MGVVAAEAHPDRLYVTTADALFSLTDMARARAFPGATAVRFLRSELEPRWRRVGEERARYTAGCAPELAEAPSVERLLSEVALQTLQLARWLAIAEGMSERLSLEDLLLALLLLPAEPWPASAAHIVLCRLGLPPRSLSARWHAVDRKNCAGVGFDRGSTHGEC